MFFTGGTENAEGKPCHGTPSKQTREIITNEDKANPSPTTKIVIKLKEQGIELARRTVAKYRKIGGIPPARRRKTF